MSTAAAVANVLPETQRGRVVRFPARRGRKAIPRTAELLRLLDALEIKIIRVNDRRRPNTTAASSTLQTILNQRGEAHLCLLLRTIVESKGNERGLIDPIITAVSAVMLAYPAWPNTGLTWLEAFDSIDLEKLHALIRPMKRDHRARSMLAGMLVQSLWPVFADLKIEAPKNSKPIVRREPSANRAITIGLELMPYQATRIPTDLCRKLGIRSEMASRYICAAQRYGTRPDLVEKLSSDALVRLAGPRLPEHVRADIEARALAGEKFCAERIAATIRAAKARSGLTADRSSDVR